VGPEMGRKIPPQKKEICWHGPEQEDLARIKANRIGGGSSKKRMKRRGSLLKRGGRRSEERREFFFLWNGEENNPDGLRKNRNTACQVHSSRIAQLQGKQGPAGSKQKEQKQLHSVHRERKCREAALAVWKIKKGFTVKSHSAKWEGDFGKRLPARPWDLLRLSWRKD